MKLCVRWTFIDEIAGQSSSAAKRSHISPPCGTSLPPCEVQGSYDNYIIELQKGAASLTALHFQPGQTSDEKKQAVGTKSSQLSKFKRRRKESILSVESTSPGMSSDREASNHEANSIEACTEQVVDADGEDCHASWFASSKIAQSAKMLLISKAPEDVMPEPCVPACKLDLETETETAGDWGHPELCRRPCIFFATGECTKGSSCCFCHLPHHKPPHPDKRGREALKSMTTEQKVSLIAPLFRHKAAALKLQEQASKLLQDLAKPGDLALAGLPEHKIAGLRSSIEKMSMRQLLSVVLTGDDKAEGPQVQIVREQVEQMRMVIKDTFKFLGKRADFSLNDIPCCFAQGLTP